MLGMGMGMGGGMPQTSGYQSELMNWINANPNNPDLQMNLLGSYFDTMNPMNQRQMQSQQRADDLSLAVALMELGQEDLATGILSGYGMGAGPMQSGSPESYRRTALQNMYADKSARNPRDAALYGMLADATPEMTGAYYQEPSYWERVTAGPKQGKDIFGTIGLNMLLPGLGNLISPMNQQKYGEAQVRSGYGL
jgi:hypothetical protein